MEETTSLIGKLEQGRAKLAWERAMLAKGTSSVNYDEYKSYAKSIPMMIKTNGLGASLAFIRSKAKKKTGDNTAYGQIYSDITEYFKQKHKTYLIDLSKKELVEAVIDLDSPTYRIVTVETLAFMQWLKRFAEGLSK
jgi:CRISPR-associated protein Cmr5